MKKILAVIFAVTSLVFIPVYSSRAEDDETQSLTGYTVYFNNGSLIKDCFITNIDDEKATIRDSSGKTCEFYTKDIDPDKTNLSYMKLQARIIDDREARIRKLEKENAELKQKIINMASILPRVTARNTTELPGTGESITAPRQNAGAVNVRTGEFLVPAGDGGYIGTRCGTYYAPTGGGVINTRTGKFSPMD